MNLEILNHFQKFNFKTQFEIDENELENRYLNLQQQFHPDTAQNQVDAEINSILLNQAYKILKNPISRAIYLLQLQGIDVDSDDCAIKPTKENLIFVMELREEILENPQNKNLIKQNIKEIIAQEIPAIIDLFGKENYQEAAQRLIKIKYLDKIIFDLKKK